MYQVKRLAKKIAATMDFHKGENVVIYDVKDKTPLASFYIVIGASNTRKIRGLEEECEEIILKAGAKINHVEGKQEGSPWALIDAYDIIVNVMSSTERERLNFDKIYSKCPLVDYSYDPTKMKN